MEKAFEIQKQIRDNAKTLNSYLTDLQNWESEMKRKEAALSGEFEQALPPVRSKVKKEKPIQVKKKPESKIKASDYQSWEKFDVEKACEDIDMQDVGPTSLDGKNSAAAKMEKLREEALHEKERGNNFVKLEKWDEAISCYNRAIELVKDDAIYFANRGLCYLKKDNLHQAETDCTEALRLDPTYVKALQRRATARERLGSLRAASGDLSEVLTLEPRNKAAQAQLQQIRAKMGTKGAKSKSSPLSTPTAETTPLPRTRAPPKIIELESPKPVPVIQSALDNWKQGVGENVTVLRPVKKPPHLRSKRPLKPVPIQEIPFGKTSPEKPPTRLQIVEIESDCQTKNIGNGDVNESVDTNTANPKSVDINTGNPKSVHNIANSKSVDNITSSKSVDNITNSKSVDKNTASPESVKLITDLTGTEKGRMASLVPPVNSVQFMAEWKYLKGDDGARSDYFSIIDPSKIPAIFDNALESDILSDILRVLHDFTCKFQTYPISAYLSALSGVKRFSALALFLSAKDKQLLTTLLEHCKKEENCTEDEIAEIKNKYEL